MPNWCLTNYMFVGDKEEIKDLHDKLKSLEEMEKPLVESDFGKKWLGCVVALFGGDPEKIYCRGDITHMELLDENSLQIHTETAWGDMPEVWDFVLQNYKSIDYYFYTEEPGVCYYATNDAEGEYFPERFIIDQFDTGIEYYNEEDELFEDVSSRIGKEVKNWEEMESAVAAYNDENEDNMIYINKIEIKK